MSIKSNIIVANVVAIRKRDQGYSVCDVRAKNFYSRSSTIAEKRQATKTSMDIIWRRPNGNRITRTGICISFA